LAFRHIHFTASPVDLAETARDRLIARHGQAAVHAADVIVALGGDGLMLSTLHATEGLDVPVYGMNRGTVGFLMNAFGEDGAGRALEAAEEAVVNPLRMRTTCAGREPGGGAGDQRGLDPEVGAAGGEAAHPGGRARADGRAGRGRGAGLHAGGSTAYNYSAHGPILPIGADILALTPMSAFRPRRWRGALLPKSARVAFEVLEADKRPVSAVADSREVRAPVRIESRASRTSRTASCSTRATGSRSG
jgi:NAD+ kinase